MKTKIFLGLAVFMVLFLLINIPQASAQCAICSRVAAELGEGSAKGFNAGILYLGIFPLSVVGFMGYRWYKYNLTDTKENNS